jgi:glycerol-3-phosphate dehydrogenase
VLHVFGGKITTYRRLAEEALSKLGPWLGPTRPPWTKGVALPGGDFPATGFESLVAELARDFGFLPSTTLRRLARAYGTRVRPLLEGCHAMADLGQCFGADLYEREVAWLMDEEWATTADDILWRRSKLGLRFSAAEAKALASWLADRRVKWPAEPPPSR